jgi:zinc protease
MTGQIFKLCTLMFALVASFAACSHAPVATKEGEGAFFGTAKVHRYRLANGLKVLIIEDHSAPTFAYQTWFHVGSKDEQKGLTGLAHLFEHMMFKETKNNKEGVFDKLLESAGAEGENAFTSRDYTAYVQSMPSDKLELIARLESDRMVNLIVNKDALDKEREVVQNERRFRDENNPDGQLYETVQGLAYTKHSYHWPVIGYDADLRNASPKECDNFYKRFYAPNNATIALVGDVNPDRAIEVIGKYYKDLKSSKINRPTPNVEPRQTKPRSESAVIKTPVQKLMVAYHTTDVTSSDFPAFEVLQNILASGKSSRLYRKLVDKGIATGVDIENEERMDPSLFLFFVNMQKGRTAKEALPVIENELKDIVAGHITQDEIDRAISMHRFGLFDGLVSNSSKAHFLGFYETVAGSFRRGIEVDQELKTMSKEKLAQVAATYLRKENQTVVTGIPKGK